MSKLVLKVCRLKPKKRPSSLVVVKPLKWIMETPREVSFPEAVTGGVPIRLKDAAVARQKRQSHLEEWL